MTTNNDIRQGNIVVTVDSTGADANLTFYDLHIEASDGNSVTLDLNGHTMTVRNLYIGNANAVTNAEAVQFVVSGGTLIVQEDIRYLNDNDSTTITLKNGAKVTAKSVVNEKNKTISILGDKTGSSLLLTQVSDAIANVNIDTETLLYGNAATAVLFLDANGGTMTVDGVETTLHGISAENNTQIPVPTARTLALKRTGYRFAGWAREADATVVALENGADYTVASSETFYAVWAAPTPTTTYYWTGKSVDNPFQWTDADNWAPSADGTGFVPEDDYPGVADGDTAVFLSAVQGITDVQVASENEAQTLTIQYTGAGNTGIVINSLVHRKEHIIIENDNGGFVQLGLPREAVIGNIQVKQGALHLRTSELTIDGSLQVDAGATFWATNSFVVNGDVTNAGSFSNSANTIFKGNVTCTTPMTLGTVYVLPTNASTFVTAAGQTFSTLYVDGNATIDISAGNVSVAAFKMVSEDDRMPLLGEDKSFTVTITDGGQNRTLACSGTIRLSRVSESTGANATTGTLRLSCNGTASGTDATYGAFYMHSGTNLVIDSGYTLTVNGSFGSVLSDDFPSTITVNGRLESPSISTTTLTVGTHANSTSGYVKTGNITTAGALVSEGMMQFATDSQISVGDVAHTRLHDVKIDCGKTLTLASGIATESNPLTVTGDWELNGTFDANGNALAFTGAGKKLTGSHTFAQVTFSGAGTTLGGQSTFSKAIFQADTTINGAHSFDEFICTAPGVKLTFEGGKTQTMRNAFTITGAAGNPVLLTGSTTSGDSADWWVLDTTAVPDGGVNVRYATVSYARSVADISGSVAMSSESPEETTVNWFPPIFYWFGATDSDWNNVANWKLNSEGTVDASSVPSDTGFVHKIVVCPAASDAHTLTFPAGSDAIELKKLTIKTGTVDFQNRNIAVDDFDDSSSDDFTVESGITLRFSGSQTITGTAEYGENLSIIYYGKTTQTAVTSATSGFSFPATLANVTVEADTTLKLGGQNVTVSRTLINNGTIEIDGTGVFGVTGTMDSDSGLVRYSATTATDKTIPALAFFDLAVTDGDWSCNDALTVGNVLSVSGGSLALNQSAADTATEANSCAFTGGSISLGNGAGDSFSVREGAINFPAEMTAVFVAGTVTAETQIASATDIALYADTVFASPFVLSADVTIGGGNAIRFAKAVSGTHHLSLGSSADFADSVTDLRSMRAIGTTATAWSGAALETLSETDIFIDCADGATNATLTLSGDLSCKNLYFFRGALSAQNRTITTESDFVVWGAGYDADDPRYTGTDTRFAYYGADSLAYYPAGGMEIAGTTAAFDSVQGATFAVGKNWYDNGANLSGVTLRLPDNSASRPVFNATDTVTQGQWGLPYAVAYNMTAQNVTVTCAAGSAGVAAGAESQQVTDGGGNTLVSDTVHTGWQFYHPKITVARTVYDDVMAIQFDMSIENSGGVIQTLMGADAVRNGAWFGTESLPFAEIYADADCTTSFGSADIPAGTPLYLRVADGKTWNTDATGTTAGDADSTDRSGTHQSVTAALSLLEGVFSAADGHTMSANYGAGLEKSGASYGLPAAYTAVTDGCSPVLVAVATGQELHTEYDGTAESQPVYDAHNFIEFRYSEAVSVGDLAPSDVNRQAEATFSSASEHGGEISSNGTGITVAGYAAIASGAVDAHLTAGSGSPHALYRTFSVEEDGVATAQTHRVRVSVAGFVAGTVSAPYGSGTATYHNWVGYSNASTTPSGTVTRLENDVICDTALNALSATGSGIHTLPTLTVQNTPDGLYGPWDTSNPVFARYIDGIIDGHKWSDPDTEESVYEMIGTMENATDSYLSRLEIHLFDNAPAYDGTTATTGGYQWFSKKGWVVTTDDDTPVQETPDTSGGARFRLNQISGGIRRSSLVGAARAFRYAYHLDLTVSDMRPFAQTDILQSTKSSLFRTANTIAAETKDDGLYISLALNAADTALPGRTMFTVAYNPSESFITDLAGNRLIQADEGRGTKMLTSIDVAPPDISLSLAPAGEQKAYLIFSERLAYNGKAVDKMTPAEIDTLMAHIAENLQVVNRAGSLSDLQVSSVDFVRSEVGYTVLLANFSRAVTLDDMRSLYVQVIKDDNAVATTDVSGQTVEPTYVQDVIGNSIVPDTQHALSDFALNVVNPQYAYADGDLGDVTIWGEPTLSIHDFTAESTEVIRSGTDITVQAQITAGVARDGKPLAADGVRAVLIPDLAANIRAEWASDTINTRMGNFWRVWLPSDMQTLASGWNDSPAGVLGGVSAGDSAGLLWNFTMPNTKNAEDAFGWKGGDEIQFVFRLTDESGNALTIDPDGNGILDSVPFYALCMPSIDAATLPFVDLWSIRLQDAAKQRGGVSVYNNVINVSAREQVVLEVDMPEDGNLNVYVLTVDGNIVQRLEHGRVSAGVHYYKWNGTNRAGTAVARGMYFIRVTGSGIDETRKVMCVK